ncbi:MAG: AmmeMemoRadiSam system radical SAM enzyme [candidate division KSB1 bacterium]|nr:AmmeMemoRadiSam system radical SAM enzyme [candidate division KSB1 bacterium]MDZ7366604.1 AmmeMemoRadiSam system radical SAM enzyme [candidate division KSB1 bacterium]MDZ7406678.1 AmmeMemoRadiSam system radical SAM enzyme [candidate division KSB1 bacterium]
MVEAQFYTRTANNKVVCYLCPRYCDIGDGQTGFCFVRKNVGGTLYSLAYANPYAVHIDPIEKKPLAHYLPGTRILSIGTAGCNLGCKFCQNWDISKARYDQERAYKFTPENAVAEAIQRGCPSIAFTYNDPVIWAEYAIDIAKLAHAHGLKAVAVTAGYITPEALPAFYDHIDAANVDLKGFTENFYRKTCLAHLAPVLETLKTLKRRGTTWFEITNLVIPTLNDALEEIRDMCLWILDNLGPEVPLHFTAFHPDFKLMHLPHTSQDILEEARLLAMDIGIHYVYVGNVHTNEGNNTYCPKCKTLIVRRSWHAVHEINLQNGCCPNCGHKIPMIESEPSQRRRANLPLYEVLA